MKRLAFILLIITALITNCNRNRDVVKTSSSAKVSATIKLATYNIYFLDDQISPERKARLKKVLEKLDADIIGFEEINNPDALRNILSKDYEIAMIDDPHERQELAVAVRRPFKIVDKKYVFADPENDYEFPRSRNLLQVTIEGGVLRQQLHVFVHHAKSRRGGREETDVRREGASRLVIDYFKNKLPGEDIILMGDFNDNPDDRSLNILEYGDSLAQAGPDSTDDTFLFNATEKLVADDICSFGYCYRYQDGLLDVNQQDGTFDPRIAGARAENNFWRGKTYDYFEDVKIKSILFDQILLSMNLKQFFREANVLNELVAVEGESSHIKFVDDQIQYTRRGSLASDHVPVYVVLTLPVQ